MLRIFIFSLINLINLITLIIQFSVAVSYAETLLYTINDLRILEQEKNYQEFFQHARDVRPEGRDEDWKNMVNFMAESYIYDQMKKKIIDGESIKFLNSLLEWPTLKGNQFFLEGRGKLGIKYFKARLSELGKDKEIFKEIISFWELNKEAPKLGLEFMKLIIENRNTSFNTIDPFTFIEKGMGSELGGIVCKDENAKKYIIKHLFEVLLKEDDNNKLAAYIQKKMSPSCWTPISEELKEMLTSQIQIDKPQNQLNAYRLLKAKGTAISSSEEEFFLVLFILQAPINGSVMNSAWNELKKLGKDYQLRSQLFERIKKLDPLPGKSFAIFSEERKRVILDHIHQNFPEYMDYYAKTCLDYLKGQKNFVNGNPTPYCKDLFNSASKFESKNWVDSQLTKSYKELPKL
ncbi:MAG: hypothetical protein HQK49_06205 [Oligoflexia bacterium]|nr:hypothetical protein [Oligoflexia bacterium]